MEREGYMVNKQGAMKEKEQEQRNKINPEEESNENLNPSSVEATHSKGIITNGRLQEKEQALSKYDNVSSSTNSFPWQTRKMHSARRANLRQGY